METHPRLFFTSSGLYIPLIASAIVCLLLFYMAGTIHLIADERLYVKNAWHIVETGNYRRYWPPGYPWTISLFLRYGDSSLNAIRLFQIGCSLVTGWAIMQMSSLWFGKRGALISGIAWAFYLPLAFYTHRLFSETIFLALFVPAIYLFSCDLRTDPRQPCLLTLAAAGVLLGLSLYFRESVVLLGLPLAALLFIRHFRQPSRAAVFFISLIAVVLPWTIRNFIRYDRFIVMGNTLGVNVRQGLNSRYTNHDYNLLNSKDRRRIYETQNGGRDWIWRQFIYYGKGWKRSHNPNRAFQDLKIAMQYASEHKSAFILTRVKKIADFVTPLSFAVRDLNHHVYTGMLLRPWIRRPIICLALSCVILLWAVGWIALIRARSERYLFALMVMLIGYFFMTSLLVSMSRYSLPVAPLALVLLGSFASEPRQGQSRRVPLIWFCIGLSILAFLWYLNFKEVRAVVEHSWTDMHARHRIR